MNIDYESLADGIYNLMPNEDQAIVAFGMIPLTWMDLVTNQFKDKATKIGCKQWDIDPEDTETFAVLRDALREDLISDFQKNITVALFESAARQGRMIA